MTLLREKPAAFSHLWRKAHKSLVKQEALLGAGAPLTDPEALPGERVRRLAVLGDQRGVVALLAGIFAVALQADPLADERSDDHLEALPRRGALHAPRQPVDAQPDEQQTGDQRGHPGILRCPPQRPGGINSPAAAQSRLLASPRLILHSGGGEARPP